jgi:hypothetical protein
VARADDIVALPEFSLLTACLNWPHDEACAQSVRTAAARMGDWGLFARMVRRHRVAGLVQAALKHAGVEAAPDAAPDLTQQAGVIARRNLASVAESASLKQLFDGAGIDLFFLKGTALAVQLHGTPTLRHGKDIDLLVSREKILAACDLLSHSGYRRILPRADAGDVEMNLWFRDHKDFVLHGPFEIELHWRLFNNDGALGGFDWRAASEDVSIGGGLTLRTFDRGHQFAYLCAHGARDAWFRLKWLADICALLAKAESSEIEKLYRLAEGLRAGRAAAQALLLCERLLQLPLSATLKQEWQHDWRVRRLGVAALRSLAGDARREPVEMPFGTTRIELSRWLLGSGFAYWMQEARLTLGWRDPKAAMLPWPLRMLYPFWRPVRWLFSQAFRKSDPRQGPA